MAFDPDAYLKSKTSGAPTGFDPDEYLRQKLPSGTPEEVSKIESFLRSAAQGLTGGLADEAVGGIEALFTDKPYTQARDESRANFHAAEEANPITSVLGSLAGGVGSLAVPGMGAVGKGLTGAIATGAKLGAINAFGNSEADLTKGDVGGVASDVAMGAGTGAVLGGASDVVGKGLSFVASKASQELHDAFDPLLQRALAFGARAKDIKEGGPFVAKLQRSLKKFDELGGFAKIDGKMPSDKDLVSRLAGIRDQTTEGMKRVVDRAGGVQLDVGDVLYGLDDATAGVIQKAVPEAQATLQGKLDSVKKLIVDADGDINKLLEIKRNSGGWAKYDISKPADENRLYRAINDALDDEVTAAVDLASKRVGGAAGETLSEFNSRYEALSTLERLAFDKAARDATSSSGIVKFTDVAGGSIGGAAGGLVGGAIGSNIGYGAAVLGNAALRTTEGRLWRAATGQAIQEKLQRDAANVGKGFIPRTIQGVKEWIAQNLPFIEATMQQIAPIAKRMLGEPPGVAEATVRAMMPMLTNLMTPSAYPSEFQGKVLEPQDRLTISKQLDLTPGLSLEQKALRRAQLNKDGTIPPEVYVPAQQPSLDDQLNAYSSRLQGMAP